MMVANTRHQIARAGFAAVNSVVLPVARRGWFSPLPVGVGLIRLDVLGRRSGVRRSIPLLSARIGNRLVVSTVRQDSHWVRNVNAAGTATVWLDGDARSASASVRTGPLQVVVLDLEPAQA